MAGDPNYPTGLEEMQPLMQALDQFHQGVQGLQMGMALKNANQQVQQIKSSMAKDEEKNAALSQVAQQMVFQMNAAGADPTRIKMMFDVVNPQKPTPIQSLEQGLFGTPEQQKIAKEGLASQEASKLKIAQATLGRQQEMASFRDDLGQQKEIRTDFSKARAAYAKETKDIEKASTQARNALKVLESKGDIELMAKSVIPTLLARGSGEVGNLTEQERSVFQGRQDVISLMTRFKEGKLTGKLTPGDRDALKAVAKLYVDSAERLKKDRAHLYTGQLKETYGLDGNDVIRKLSGGKISQYEDPNADSPQDSPTANETPSDPFAKYRK